jgi:hypothetical protein
MGASTKQSAASFMNANSQTLAPEPCCLLFAFIRSLSAVMSDEAWAKLEARRAKEDLFAVRCSFPTGYFDRVTIRTASLGEMEIS